MGKYARVVDSVVAETFTPPPGLTIGDCFHSGVSWVPCDDAVVVGDSATATGDSWTFGPPPTPQPLPLPLQAQVMLQGGLHLTFASNHALDGTYSVGADVQSHIQAELWSILLNGKFADGSDTVVWPDISNRPETNRTFPDTASFKAFATAAASFVAGLAKVQIGTSTTLPPADVTIS